MGADRPWSCCQLVLRSRDSTDPGVGVAVYADLSGFVYMMCGWEADTLNNALSLLVCSDLVSESDMGLCLASNECSSAGPSVPIRTHSPLATMTCDDEGDRYRKASASGTMCTLQPESMAMLDHFQPVGAGASGALADLLLTKGWWICRPCRSVSDWEVYVQYACCTAEGRAGCWCERRRM